MSEHLSAEAPPGAPERIEDSRDGGAARRRRPSLLALIERYALLLGLGIIILIFSVLPATSESFLTTVNIQNLLTTQTVISIAAIAILMPLIAGEFDITVGAVIGMSSYATASAITHGWAIAPAIAIALVVCLCVGVINGTLVAFVRANSIIITLAMATFITGIVSLYSKDETLIGVPEGLTSFGNGLFLGIPDPAWVLVAVALVVWYVLNFTLFGRQLLMIGSSERSAELLGAPTRRVVFIGFLVTAVLCGVAGVIALSLAGSASPSVGPENTLPAVAAAFLGSTTIKPGQFNVPGTIVGVFFVGVMVNGLTLAGAADWVDPVFNGAAVVIAVTASTLLRRRRESGRVSA